MSYTRNEKVVLDMTQECIEDVLDRWAAKMTAKQSGPAGPVEPFPVGSKVWNSMTKEGPYIVVGEPKEQHFCLGRASFKAVEYPVTTGEKSNNTNYSLYTNLPATTLTLQDPNSVKAPKKKLGWMDYSLVVGVLTALAGQGYLVYQIMNMPK